jgi:hypothetical protein
VGDPVQLLSAVCGETPLHMRESVRSDVTVRAAQHTIPTRKDTERLFGSNRRIHNVCVDYDEQRKPPSTGMRSILNKPKVTLVEEVYMRN